MTKIATNCSVLQLGSRGFLIPTVRKNPRFPAGTKFKIKKVQDSQLLIKLDSSSSIFAIRKVDAKEVLGLDLEEYLNCLTEKKNEGLKMLAQALIESKFFVEISGEEDHDD